MRDLIARRHLEGEDVWAAPSLPVEQAIRRMRAHGISQMAVVEEGVEQEGGDAEDNANGANGAAASPGGAAAEEAAKRRRARARRVVGIIDESDLLLGLLRDGRGATARPVSDYMERRVETVAPTAPHTDALPLLRAGRVAVVAGEGGRPFYGLVTNIDLINYLRARVD